MRGDMIINKKSYVDITGFARVIVDGNKISGSSVENAGVKVRQN